MPDDFQPSFEDFQKDIEDFLTSIGKRERTKEGLTIFRGYPEAQELMFRRYLEHEAFDPLVTHFRGWNWEVGYNDFLLELTAALVNSQDWSRLQRLWDGVIAKRRKFYNDVWKIEKDEPGTLPSKSVTEAKERLLETLGRIQGFAEAFGQPGDADKYTDMMGRVQQGKRAK